MPMALSVWPTAQVAVSRFLPPARVVCPLIEVLAPHPIDPDRK